jgi:hypothetical protein
MESNRRFRRPRIVTRAVRKLRARAASTNYGRSRAASELNHPQPHLSLVTEPLPADETVPDAAPEAPPAKRRSRVKWTLFGILMLGLAVLAALAYYEMRTSTFQAHFFSKLAARLTYKVEPGPSPTVRFPHDSPYDERLGYANLPDYLAKLKARDYQVEAQARLSPKMVELADMGLFATYREKTKVGLEILDCKSKPLFTSQVPGALLRVVQRCARVAGPEPAVHRKPRTARSQDPQAQPGRRVGPLQQGGARQGAEHFQRRRQALGRRQHPGHPDRKIPPFAGRTHQLAVRKTGPDGLGHPARLPGRRRHHPRGARSSPTT